MHHAHSALADANGADRSQQRTQSQSFQNRLQQHSLSLLFQYNDFIGNIPHSA